MITDMLVVLRLSQVTGKSDVWFKVFYESNGLHWWCFWVKLVPTSKSCLNHHIFFIMKIRCFCFSLNHRLTLLTDVPCRWDFVFFPWHVARKSFSISLAKLLSNKTVRLDSICYILIIPLKYFLSQPLLPVKLCHNSFVYVLKRGRDVVAEQADDSAKIIQRMHLTTTQTSSFCS